MQRAAHRPENPLDHSRAPPTHVFAWAPDDDPANSCQAPDAPTQTPNPPAIRWSGRAQTLTNEGGRTTDRGRQSTRLTTDQPDAVRQNPIDRGRPQHGDTPSATLGTRRSTPSTGHQMTTHRVAAQPGRHSPLSTTPSTFTSAEEPRGSPTMAGERGRRAQHPPTTYRPRRSTAALHRQQSTAVPRPPSTRSAAVRRHSVEHGRVSPVHAFDWLPDDDPADRDLT